MEKARCESRKRLYLKKNNLLVYGQGNRLWIKSGESNCRTVTLPLSCKQKCISEIRLLQRLLRTEINHVVDINHDIILIFAFRSIFRYSILSGKITDVTPIVGGRPLIVCKGHDNEILYGEYRNNRERSPISLLKSKNSGIEWECVYQFSSVRHIHGIFFDSFEQCYWITTGDEDDESAIWRADFSFKNVEKVVFGSQQSRAVSLQFTKDYIFYGSDTPDEHNYLYSYCRLSGEVKQLMQVGGSVFYSCRVGNTCYFSTACEPSEVNCSRSVELWEIINNRECSKVLSFKKDYLPMKYFQYGQILFPQMDDNEQNLWFTPYATNCDNSTFTILS